MAIFEWDTNYSVNNLVMDEHHKKLFDILNNLYDLMGKGADDDNIIRIIKELLDYTHYHFSEEEKMMEQESYPDLAKHKQLHRDFIAKMEDYLKKSQNGNAIFIVTEVADTGVNWLKTHILTVDTLYKKFIEQQKST